MSIARKTLAKYGAKIPAARKTGTKPSQPVKQGAPVDALPKAGQSTKKSDDKKD